MGLNTSEPNNGVDIYEYQPPEIKARQIVRLVFSAMAGLLGVVAYQIVKGIPIFVTIGVVCLCAPVIGIVLYFSLRGSSKASIALNWDSNTITFVNSFTKKAIVSVGTASHIESPMSDVIRLDTKVDGGHQTTSVTFPNGTASFSDCYTGYDELVAHLTEIVAQNDHPKSHATTAELEWRTCGIAILIAIPVLITIVALSIWFVTQ